MVQLINQDSSWVDKKRPANAGLLNYNFNKLK